MEGAATVPTGPSEHFSHTNSPYVLVTPPHSRRQALRGSAAGLRAHSCGWSAPKLPPVRLCVPVLLMAS